MTAASFSSFLSPLLLFLRRLRSPDDPPTQDVDRTALPSNFSEEDYLAANADVRHALQAGAFPSGAAHFLAHGRAENRPLRENVVRSLEGLDREIEKLKVLERTSFDAWLHERATFRYDEDTSRLPADPFSSTYRDAQIALYREIAGVEEYDPWASEPIPISLEHSADPHPFPYSTRNGFLIAGHLRSLANIFDMLWKAWPDGGQRILEYGCGTGFTTMMLATAGYRMVAVDINAQALAVIDKMASVRGLDVRTHCGVFGAAPDAGRHDVILFYGAFHHSLEFMEVLSILHDRLAPGGVVIFAEEPIVDDFPKPWGLRLDGASLWEIRTKGWLELGFNTKFFQDALARAGWSCERLRFGNSPDIFVARSTRATA